jgi:hypothetical protein
LSQLTDPRYPGDMDANVIPFRPKASRRRIVRRTAAPVIDVTPYLREKRKQEELARIGSEVAALLAESRRIRRGDGPRYPDGPGTAVAL